MTGREHQPAIKDRPACASNPVGDGVGHAATLRTMIHIREDGEACVCAECRAIQAAIAAADAPTIDLDAEDWKAIQQAASESKWMPADYMRNDWVSDVCSFLRDGLTAAGRGGEGEPVAFITHSTAALSRVDMTQEGMSLGIGKHLVFAAAPQQPLPAGQASPVGVTDAIRLLREYRAAPKFSHDHATIKRTVALEDEIDAFLSRHNEAGQAAPSEDYKRGWFDGSADTAELLAPVEGVQIVGAPQIVPTPAAPEPAASERTRMDDMIEHGMSGIDWTPSAAS